MFCKQCGNELNGTAGLLRGVRSPCPVRKRARPGGDARRERSGCPRRLSLL